MKSILLMYLLTFALLSTSIASNSSVWFLYNNDKDYSTPPFNDTLRSYNNDGIQLSSTSGFNISGSIGASRTVSFSSKNNYAWVAENTGKKLSKISKRGTVLFQKELKAAAIDTGYSSNNLYLLTSSGTIYGKDLKVLDPNGNELNQANFGGIDLSVDERNDSIWIVGAKIFRLNLKLEQQFSIDPVDWTAVSVDFTNKKTAWVAERRHGNTGINRIIHIDSKGIILETVSLPDSPLCLRVDKVTGQIWIATLNGLYKYDKINGVIKVDSARGYSLAIDYENNEIWWATKNGGRKYNKTGELLLKLEDMNNPGQTYVTSKKYDLSLWPKSCSEVLKSNLNASDGEYILYLNNNPQRPWSVYCKDMQNKPKEYVTLQNTCEGQNYSLYAAGGARKGFDVVTKFMKVRIEPKTLELVRDDLSFATSWGKITWGQNSMVSMSYASAGDCISYYSNFGTANIDLRGTPFKVKTDNIEQFIISGYKPNGTIIYNYNDQVVNLTGGGYCGKNQPGSWWKPKNLILEYIVP